MGGLTIIYTQPLKEYTLTETNTLKLENMLLKFYITHSVPPRLISGITGKVIYNMYRAGISYYYGDRLATATNTPIQVLNNIYNDKYNSVYEPSLTELLQNQRDYTGTTRDVEILEKGIKNIIKTRKPQRNRKQNKRRK